MIFLLCDVGVIALRFLRFLGSETLDFGGSRVSEFLSTTTLVFCFGTFKLIFCSF